MLTQQVTLLTTQEDRVRPMVEVELRQFEELDYGEGEWRTIERLKVDGEHQEIAGEVELIDFDVSVINRRTGKRLTYSENPEEWARNLGSAYHAPDLVAVVVNDTNPVPEAPEMPRERVVVPDTTKSPAHH